MRFWPLVIAAVASASSFMSTAAPSIPELGTWTTTLLARDIDGDGVAEGYYDTALDITWFNNTTQPWLSSWDMAQSWVATLDVKGVSGWRLPHANPLDSSNCGAPIGVSEFCQLPPPSTSSEFAHLFYVTLGNNSDRGGLTNAGPFPVFLDYFYWMDKEFALNTDYAWGFDAAWGRHREFSKTNGLFAWAVHDGDIALVPEVNTFSMLAIGLVVMGITRTIRGGLNCARESS